MREVIAKLPSFFREVKIVNKVILMGRLTKDPDVRYTQGEKPMAVARYTVAVNRVYKRDGEPEADFINCVAFGRTAEFAEKYFRQGIKIAIVGKIQTGSYVNKDGVKVYTTDVIVDEQEFAESKISAEKVGSAGHPAPKSAGGDGFMNIPKGIDEELPFA